MPAGYPLAWLEKGMSERGGSMVRPSRLVWLAVLAGLMALTAFAFRHPGMQGVNWSFPYFSGAANLEAPFEWRISPAEYAAVRSMPVSEYRAYRHAPSAVTVPNTYNNYGYVFVVYAARKVFGALGDANAAVVLQVLTHIAVVLCTLVLLRSPVQRAFFFVVFGLNPVILRVVTFPFYYFWTVIPSFVVALTWFRGKTLRWSYLALSPLLYLAFLIRPMTAFVIALTFGIGILRHRNPFAAFSALIFGALVLASPMRSGSAFWHTAYVGIGAYGNRYDIALSDDSPYAHYQAVTGTPIETDPITGTFQDSSKREAYLEFLKTRYLSIVREDAPLLARNALLNLAQSFGLGHATRSDWLNAFSSIIGLGMMAAVVLSKQWIWGVGLLAYALAFAPYYPPIPVYLFGGYFFTALILCGVAERAYLRVPFRPRTLAAGP